MPQAPARRDVSGSSDVADLVRLHHRRRGWAWVAMGSVIGLVVYVGVDVNLFDSLTGTTEILSVIPVLVLLALALAGLVMVIVDTSRIRRADAAVQAGAKGSVSHYPLYAHAHSYPPRHHGSWVFAICVLVAMTGFAVALLPAQVNSWAYALGAESHDTFNPVSYAQTCTAFHYRGCNVVTEGYLSRSGAHATWGGQVPLGQPFGVRDPVLGVGHRAESDQRRRLGDPEHHRGPVLRRDSAAACVRTRRDSAAQPGGGRGRPRRPGRGAPGAVSSRPRPPRKRRSSPRPPPGRQTLI